MTGNKIKDDNGNIIKYTSDNYKDWLKTSITDIYSSAGKDKLNPKKYLSESNSNDIFILNLDSTSLIFDHFINGNLIIYGNTDYFIDDIANTNILNEEPTAQEVNYMLENLYKKILDETINSQTPTENNDKIVIKSKGINSAYSTLSLANNNCQCYLYNLNI